MTVSRANAATFIQTYRNSDTDYQVEVHSGAADAEYFSTTTVHDVNVVGQLIWDWLENDWQRLDAIVWEQQSL
ncbi:hypothetical protein [Nocardia lijiangensis]|uniref:hypothetical protein n=1 Tax=Nocardia lijiangensis TaxID=299618 RepID=UPI00082D60E0|nr:hypothetical protein [Nocardia lijiangensis]